MGSQEFNPFAALIAELKTRFGNVESANPFGEMRPVGRTAKLAVGDRLQADLLLERYDVADCFVLR